jgi:hypothetical protein
MRNLVADSPITLTTDHDAAIPDVPPVVEDAFGRRALATLHRDRWCALIPRDGGHVFAWLGGRSALTTAITTHVTSSQTLESDPAHRALVIAGEGEALYAVEPDGTAHCLGVLPGQARARTACWLAGGGVAIHVGDELQLHVPGAGGGDTAPLVPLARIPARTSSLVMRCLPHERDAAIHVLAFMADDRGALLAITHAGDVHTLADFEELDLGDVRLFLDETGDRTQLRDGATLSLGAQPTTVGGIAQALAALDRFPRLAASLPPPPLVAGPDRDPTGALLELPRTPPAAAARAPALDRLAPLTRALIAMLRSAPAVPTPRPELLQLIRERMPLELRAYLHA